MFKITRFKLYFYPLLVLVLGLTVSVYVFQLLATDFQTQHEAAFRYQARLHADALEERLDQALELLEVLRDFQITREQVAPEEFKQFVDKLLEHPREIQAMFWIPRMSREELQYLSDSLLAGDKKFISHGIWQSKFESEKDQVMPVVYAIPGHKGDTQALYWRGEDIARHRLFTDALDRVTESRRPVSSEVFSLADNRRELGLFFVRFAPGRTLLYRGEQEAVKTSSSFVAMLINIQRWVDEALSKFSPGDIRLYLFDRSDQLVATHGRELVHNELGTPLGELKKSKPVYTTELSLSTKEWQVIIRPGSNFSLRDYSREAWVALSGGLIVTLLATAFLFSLLKWSRQNERRATVDHLTGLYNRRKFLAELDEETERARRYDHPLSLLLLDLDDFKEINDTYGHPTGDRVLENLGEVIRKNTRETDLPARYGGEEFVVLCPETKLDEARKIARRIKSQFASLTFSTRKDEKFSLTCSVGVATNESGSGNVNLLVAKADEALYRAKNSGKNRVETAEII